MLRGTRGAGRWGLALALCLVVGGIAWAGGARCQLAKGVSKSAKMTDDGAVVTLKGKTPEAVKMIQAHLTVHEKGGDCPDCPFSMEGVTSKVKMTEKGGEITMTGASPEAVRAVQEWAKKPAGDCCGKQKSA